MGKKSFAKQLSQSFLREQKGFTKQQGFALSIDALLATILTLTVLTFVGFEMQSSEESITPSEIRIRQSVDDTFTVLDNSGFLVHALVDVTEANPAVTIFEKVKTLVSKNIGLGIEVTEYEPTGTGSCNDFDECFGESKEVFTANIPIPSDREIMHGRKILITKSLGGDVAGNQCRIIETEFFKEKEKITAMFEGEEKAVSTQVMVSSTSNEPQENLFSELSCDEKAIVTLKMKDNSRDPIAVVMAMDRSESMAKYDMSQGNVLENTPAIDEIGTCGGLVCESGIECETPYTNWIETVNVGSFTTTQDLLDSMPSNGRIRLDVETQSGQGTGECGNVPRIKVKDPGGNWIPAGENGQEPDLYIYKSTLDNFPVDSVWDIWLWSEKISNLAYIQMKIEWVSYELIETGEMKGTGTADYSGIECENYDGWEKIGEFMIDDPDTTSAYGRFEYSGYDGKCEYLGVKVKTPSGGWFEPQHFECPKPNNAWCVSSENTNEQGIYEIWAWSDYVMNYTSKYYLYKNKGTVVNWMDIKNGLCNGMPCTSDIVSCENFDNYQNMGTFSIPAEDNLRGVYFKLNAGETYSGKCTSIKARLSNSSYTHDAIYYSGCYKAKCEFCINGREERTCINPYDALPNDSTPVTTGNWDLEIWSTEPKDSWNLEMVYQRIDASKNAAKTFIDNTEWESGDKLGLISFSDLANVESQLTNNNAEIVKTALNSLVPGGQTGLAGAISQATAMLTNESLSAETSKFIVLLTDGKANMCIDGESCSEEEAGIDAITAADSAREDAGASIYVIGFADPSIGDYADTLKQIAKDPGEGDCVGGLCGKYYFAEDEEELEEIYSRVVGDIRESFGTAEIKIPLKEGIELIDPDNPGKSGIWNDSEETWDTEIVNNPELDLEWNEETRVISVNNKAIHYTEEDLWFAMQFEIVVPCNGSYCDLNYVIFPSEEMEIIDEDRDVTKWTKETGNDKYCNGINQPCSNNKYVKMPFKYKDLGINFVSGTIVGNGILLDLNVGNGGFKDIYLASEEPLKIKFLNLDGSVITNVICDGETCDLKASNENPNDYLINGIAEETGLGEIKLGNIILCSVLPDASSCTYGTAEDTETTIENIKIPTTDPRTIIAEIDSDSINECSKRNTARIYCGEEKFKFLTIDYYAWVK